MTDAQVPQEPTDSEVHELFEEASQGLDRATVIKRIGAAGVGASFLLGMPGISTAATARRSSGSGGRKRKIVWVTHNVGDWNFPIDIGFLDATRQVGWTYQKVGSRITTTDVTVNNQLKAITLKPDVLVATWVEPAAFLVPLKKALAAGIYVIINNTNQTDSGDLANTGNELNIPYVGQSFLGAGSLLGQLIAKRLVEQGRKDGVVVDGNNQPGHYALEQRHKGLATGLRIYNKRSGTNFTTEQLADKSGTDIALAVPLWKAKIRQLGSRYAGGAGVGYLSGIAALEATRELGIAANKTTIGSFDTDPKLLQGIKDGYVSVLIDQQLYSQGYVPTMLAWQDLERGFKPTPAFNCGQGVVDKTNVDKFLARDVRIDQLAKQYGLKK